MPYSAVEVVVYIGSLAIALIVGIWLGAFHSRKTVGSLRKQVEQATALLAHGRKVESLGRFAGGIAHDFNNLLTVIQGHSELITTKLARQGIQGIETQELATATSRAAALTRQLLAYSRHRPMQVAPWDINRVIDGMKVMLQSLVGERYSLSYDLRPAGAVRIDRSKFEQVVLNLVLNARDALGPSGAIVVSTRAVDSAGGAAGPPTEALLEVIDSGIGMDPETAKKIFDPFFTTKERGTGLGLATVREIVEEAGGRIVVESKLGRGTTMRVILPSGTERATEETAPSRPVCEEQQHGRILVVEDEKIVTTLLKKMLEQAGYAVEHVQSAAEALAVLEHRATEFDLVLTDVVMAQMSGTELALLIRQRFLALPVLLMSASAEPESTLNGSGGMVAGDLYLLQKPFSSAVLLEKVRGLIHDRRSKRHSAHPDRSPAP